MMSLPAAEEVSAAEQAALRDQCSVFLAGHGRLTAADLLAGEVRDLVLDHPADPLVTEAARLLARPGAQAGDVAARLGVGERQLLRRCRAAAGYGPATLRRVLRFRRFVARVDAGEGLPGGSDLARLAADTGYADQAHLTHECIRLAGLPPAALTAERRRP